MSSDVLIDVNASSASDDSDAVNTEAARVYFGPLQSPEKKLATRGVKTPLRRSARLSHAPILLESDTDAEERPSDDADAASREGTPVQDLLQDEPSFVLASRILRAHDNPSPPPSPPPPERASRVSFDLDAQMIQQPFQDGIFIPIMSSPPARPSDHQSSLHANISQPDLINFDSFSTPTASPRMGGLVVVTRPETPSPRASQTATVDDLLSISPSPARPSATDVPNPEQPISDETTPTTDEEHQVLEVLAFSSRTSVESEPEPAADLQPQVAPQTPIRRSTRARRSSSPHRPKLVSELSTPARSNAKISPHNLLAAVQEDATDQLLAPPSALRIKKRARSRDISPSEKATAGPQSVDCAPPETNEEQQTTRPNTPVRELGSLSPTSAAVLFQLIPNASASENDSPEQPAQAAVSAPVNEPSPSTPNEHPTITFPSYSRSQNATTFNVLRPLPLDSLASSPSKLPDPPRSPARRVPLRQAMIEGTFSPQKHTATNPLLARHTAPNFGLLGSPVFKRPMLNDPQRSPAKRVPIAQAQPAPSSSSPAKGKTPIRPRAAPRENSAEPGRGSSVEPKPVDHKRERSRSAEPTRPVVPTPTAGKDGSSTWQPSRMDSKPGTSSRSSTRAETARDPLPFPIVASSRRPPASIPEEEEEAPSVSVEKPMAVGSSPASSPAKQVSSLKQPTAGSRIPRIGTKPYARPKPAATPVPKESKQPVTMRRAEGVRTHTNTTAGTSSARPMRLVRTVTSDSSSKYVTPTPAPDATGHSSTGSTAAETSAAKSLKRKRELEQPRASSPGSQPVVVVRKVVPGMFGQSQPSKPGFGGSSPLAPSPARLQSRPERNSPQKQSGPMKMRRAVDWKRPPREPTTSQSPLPPPVGASEAASVSSAAREKAASDTVKEGSAAVKGTHTVAKEATPLSALSDVPLRPSTPLPERPASPTPLAELDTQTSSTRRSPRSRTSSEPAADVFGAVANAAVRPLNVRRKRTKPIDTGPFFGMTATALKALTTSNTTKNQQQVAEIQTEVIRKEGKRPDSPTTKVRTVLERQKQLKTQERQERAARRARRSSEAPPEADTEPDESVDVEGSVGDISLDMNGVPLRHRRAPGDEEDYETPPRPERPAKRGRFDEGIETREGKRVKWDRGLATTVYIDSSPPKPRRPKDVATRGCLAAAAKTLRLDTLGNVLDAVTPLPELVRENIIVQKFLYEDDSDPAAEIATPPPVIKAPKTKSKKTKAS
ncbi:predicted protein [Postia placenta Mad-698-R]|nr:predicted protein [Postia placenta Mad-698-R]